MLQSRAQGLPQAAASPPPSGQGQPRPSGIQRPLATGSSEAGTVEGKGNGREERQKGKESGFVAECGGRQPPKEPPAPQPRPQLWSQARFPCGLPGCPNSCYKKGRTESVRRRQSGLGGGSSPHKTFLGPFKTRVPALSRCRNHVGAGVGWGGAVPRRGRAAGRKSWG